MPSYKMNLPTPRAQLMLTAQGLITENFERASVSTTSLAIDGTAYFMLVGLRASDLITNVHVCVTAAGADVTLSKVGLYDKSGVRLAASADLGTEWQSAGEKTHALSSPYRVTVDDGYYVAVIAKATTTLPTFLRGATSTHTTAGFGGGSVSYGTEAAQTDLDATATIVQTSPIGIWVGVS